MAMVTVNFRMDEELKKAMEKVCEELGMNMTTAFMIYAKKMTREHRIAVLNWLCLMMNLKKALIVLLPENVSQQKSLKLIWKGF